MSYLSTTTTTAYRNRGGSALAPLLAAVVASVACVAALVVQTTVLPHLAWRGTSADLVLVVVVTAGLVCGSRFAMLLGFAAGLLVDLAPPADHVAGRWALALLVVGYVAGRVRPEIDGDSAAPLLAPDHRPRGGLSRFPVLPTLAVVAGCSFLGTSVFALTGLALDDGGLGVADLLRVVLVGVAMDVVAAPLVVPWLARLLRLGRRDVDPSSSDAARTRSRRRVPA